MKRVLFVVLSLLIVSGISLSVVLVLTSYFKQDYETINMPEVHEFQFSLFAITDVQTLEEIHPGEGFKIKPVVENTSTEEMFVFMQIDMPLFEDTGLSNYETYSKWLEVSKSEANNVLSKVYAYIADENNMYCLLPGDITTPLTQEMAMINITYPEYASIDSKDFTVGAFEIGTEDVSTLSLEAWDVCKNLGDISQ